MEAFLRLSSRTLSFADQETSQNPVQRFVDWSYDVAGLPVQNPQGRGHTVGPGQTSTIFDGTRTLTLNGSTAFDLTLVDGTTDTYRLTWTGAGADPGFRTDRGLDFSTETVTVVLNENGTAVFTCSGDISDVVVGDIVLIPTDADLGGSQPLHAGNQGFWVVLAKSGQNLTMTRDGDFEGNAEGPITITAAEQFQAYSPGGVQAGDGLDILSGFVASNQRTFSITVATSTYLQFESSLALAEESAVVPTASGLFVYTQAKRYLRVEGDQECVVRVNDDTGNFQRMTPWVAGDKKQAGIYERAGTTWKLAVVNRSSKTLNLVVISCE